MMNKIILGLLSLTFQTASAESAEPVTKQAPIVDVGALMGEFQTLKGGLSTLNSQMETADEAVAPLKKENKVYLDDQALKKNAITAAIQQQKDLVLAPRVAKLDKKIAAWNARCSREFNPKTEMGAYNQCESDYAVIEQERKDGIAWWKEYSDKWVHANVDPLVVVMEKQNARIANNSAKIEKWTKAYNNEKAQFIAAKARIDKILRTVKAYCRDKPAPTDAFVYGEWIKWCSNIDWDGTSTALPPMYHSNGIGGATSN